MSRVLVVFGFLALVATVLGAKDKLIPGEYIVRLQENIPAVTVQHIFNGAKILNQLESRGKIIAFIRADDNVARRIANHPLVDVFENNREVSLNLPEEPKLANYVNTEISNTGDICHEQENTNDTQFNIWGLIRTSHRDQPDYENDKYMWHHDGEGVDLYVVDSGIDICHPDFEGRARFGMYASTLDEGYTDLNGHGTHVASTAAGKNWGLAKKASLISLKVLGRWGVGTSIGIYEGIDWVMKTVKAERAAGKKPRPVINMSLGTFAFSRIMYDLLQEAWDMGIINIAAAGNNAGSAKGMFPAAHDNVITVGATNINDGFSVFSNWGCNVAVNAPGSDITAAWSTQTPLCNIQRPLPEDCITSVSGTSMASPHVMGIVARYLSSLTDAEYEEMTPKKMQDILTATAVKDKLTFGAFPPGAATTTNRILHKECGNTAWNPEDVYEPCPFIPPEEDEVEFLMPAMPEEKNPVPEGDVVPGEYLIRLNRAMGVKHQLRRLLSEVGGKLVRFLKVAHRDVALVQIDESKAKLLKKSSWVEHMEPNRIYRLIEPVDIKPGHVTSSPKVSDDELVCHEQENTNDTQFNIWGLIRTSHKDLPDFQEDHYIYNHQGEGVDLYIIDTGIDACHPDFDFERATYGFYASNLDEGYVDLNGHGSHVASTAAGVKWGLAKKANLYSVKVLGRFGVGMTSGIVEGIEWVNEHVRQRKAEGKNPRAVINLSLGGFGFSREMYDALQDGWDMGIVNIAAAGNNAGPASGMFPAAHDNVITVGATNSNDGFSAFSNHGCEVAVSAPGSDITAAWSTQTLLCQNMRPIPRDCIASVSGTSMAAPHVMGIVARYLSSLTDEEFASVTPKYVMDMLTATAVKDHITFGPLQGTAEEYTTNRLLHKTCGVTSWNPEDTYEPCPFTPPDDPEDPEDPGKPDPVDAAHHLGFSVYCLLIVTIIGKLIQ